MKVAFIPAVLLLFGSFLINPLPADESRNTKPSAARLNGMKEALADIEHGHFRQKEFPLPAPAWFGDYIDLLKTKCGVEWVTVEIGSRDPKDPRAEIDGYNDVMRVEIEHQFGKGILEKLRKQAEAGIRKSGSK